MDFLSHRVEIHHNIVRGHEILVVKLVHRRAHLLGLARKAQRYDLIGRILLDPECELFDWTFPVAAGAQDVLDVILG